MKIQYDVTIWPPGIPAAVVTDPAAVVAAPPEAVVAPTAAVVASPAAAVVAAAPPATVVTVFTVHTISSAIVD